MDWDVKINREFRLKKRIEKETLWKERNDRDTLHYIDLHDQRSIEGKILS